MTARTVGECLAQVRSACQVVAEADPSHGREFLGRAYAAAIALADASNQAQRLIAKAERTIAGRRRPRSLSQQVYTTPQPER